MAVRLALVVAACTNRGIGINGGLPWKIRGDMAFFKRITSEASGNDKQNVVIMGRRTWESIPDKFRPLPNRINVVISTTLNDCGSGNVHLVRSFNDAIQLLSKPELCSKVERVFVIGGQTVYLDALKSGLCDRIYLTEVLKEFECDVYLPEFNSNEFEVIKEAGVDSETMTDEASQIQYRFVVYRKKANLSSPGVERLPLFVSVAVESDGGFGLNGVLPWNFKKEMDHFISLITKTSDSDKKVAVIKGRKTWESSSVFERSLPSLINIVISESLNQLPENVHYLVRSFDDALSIGKQLFVNGTVEKIWVLGGKPVYEAAINSGYCQKIFVTRIQASFSCDVFFPRFEDKFHRISCEDMEDEGVKMKLEVYEPNM